MIGSLLVLGFIFITLILAITLYFSNVNFLKFTTLAVFFAWSSSVFFLIHNYEGWPSKEMYPDSQVVSIEIFEPTDDNAGKIYVWTYDISQSEKYFWEYNPTATPRAYEIPYTEKSGKAFSEARDKLSQGYSVYIKSKNDNSGEGKEGSKATGEDPNGGGDLLIPYELDKPPIKIENPQTRLNKK